MKRRVKVVLNINYVRENTDKVKEGIKKKGYDPKKLDRVFKVDETRRQLIGEVERWRRAKNLLDEQVEKKPTQEQIEKGKKIKGMLQRLEPDLRAVEEELQMLLYEIPNLPADDVPEGKDESDNVEIKKHGQLKKFSFKPKDHLELGEALGIIDVKRAAKVSGTRFGYFRDQGAVLEMALMWHVFKKLAKKGFEAVIPPVIVKKEIEQGLGYVEHGGWDEAYLFEKDQVVFTASSEHAVIPLYANETLVEKQLPKRFVNFSTCFRREAGSYGQDTRGMLRLHQFNKVEMNVYTIPDLKVSDKECLDLLSIQEKIVRELKLPYRVVHSCLGDLPFPNRRMYDLEIWFPGQKRYRETHSCSNCTDFQARRLKIKVKTKEGRQFIHALNATAATDRLVLAILENHQQKDGSVKIPKALQKYTSFKKISLKR
ncbi:serine--tRNA ligase [Patescibacteria group bacterium]